MAIPIYVPEEYGPEPSPNTSNSTKNTEVPSNSNNDGTSSNSGVSALTATSSMTSMSFLHQLIHELYNFYRSFNNNVYFRDQSSSSSSNSRRSSANNNSVLSLNPEGIPPAGFDPNNNQDEFINIHEIRRTRRRHAAGNHGFCNHHQFMANLVQEEEEAEEEVVRPQRSVVTNNTSNGFSINSVQVVQDQVHVQRQLFNFKVETSNISIGCTLRKLADSFEKFQLDFHGERRDRNFKYELKLVTSWPVLLAGVFISAAGAATASAAMYFMRRC